MEGDFADALGADVVLPVNGLTIWQLRQEIVRLEHDLKEANSEIGRHHRDFAQVVLFLDLVEAGHMEAEYALKKIRGVVG